MKKKLFIRSTIHNAGVDHPDIIEQQVDAEFVEMEDEMQIFYQEGSNKDVSDVRILAFDDHMIVLRMGAIRYEQTYVMNEITKCLMEVPGGQLELLVQTHQYKRGLDYIFCQFSLKQTNQTTLGEYQLELKW
ncbi:DUF1934 domain-containing protein [Shimazuella kribbensis]|uniref:DUF1934 domain-containing protein n=1 Tax=Shimazuella kribbensis TaxID=139808 RepID=UPI00041C6C69|nr:DUF1934 domain-containing protein [Shimazuella kribbensis]